MDYAIETVYVVWETLNEYGKKGQCVGVYDNKVKAEDIAKGRGWYGGNGAIDERTAIVNGNDECFVLDNTIKEGIPLNIDYATHLKEAKAEALSKIIDSAKRILGLIQENKDENITYSYNAAENAENG